MKFSLAVCALTIACPVYLLCFHSKLLLRTTTYFIRWISDFSRSVAEQPTTIRKKGRDSGSAARRFGLILSDICLSKGQLIIGSRIRRDQLFTHIRCRSPRSSIHWDIQDWLPFCSVEAGGTTPQSVVPEISTIRKIDSASMPVGGYSFSSTTIFQSTVRIDISGWRISSPKIKTSKTRVSTTTAT